MNLSILTRTGVIAALLSLWGTADGRHFELGWLSASSREYLATGRSQLRSTLTVQTSSGRHRLRALTRFDGTGWLSEEATLDESGRLIRAEIVLSRPGEPETGTLLDAARGVVEVADGAGVTSWAVPNDLPWTWTCSLGGRDFATPLSALVALHGAGASQALRQIDLRAGDSHSIASDQLRVPDSDGSPLVILGDDVVSFRDGLPERWRAAAFGVDVHARIAGSPLLALASLY